MGPRWGFGPVFANEWLTTSRRWQIYAVRTVFVGVLLVGLWSVWVSRTSGQTVTTIQLWAEIGEGFFNAIVFTQLSLVILAAISPFDGLYTLIASGAFPRFIADAFLWIPCWIAAETVIAAGLLLATLATFDRCLGRTKSFGR